MDCESAIDQTEDDKCIIQDTIRNVSIVAQYASQSFDKAALDALVVGFAAVLLACHCEQIMMH